MSSSTGFLEIGHYSLPSLSPVQHRRGDGRPDPLNERLHSSLGSLDATDLFPDLDLDSDCDDDCHCDPASEKVCTDKSVLIDGGGSVDDAGDDELIPNGQPQQGRCSPYLIPGITGPTSWGSESNTAQTSSTMTTSSLTKSSSSSSSSPTPAEKELIRQRLKALKAKRQRMLDSHPDMPSLELMQDFPPVLRKKHYRNQRGRKQKDELLQKSFQDRQHDDQNASTSSIRQMSVTRRQHKGSTQSDRPSRSLSPTRRPLYYNHHNHDKYHHGRRSRRLAEEQRDKYSMTLEQAKKDWTKIRELETDLRKKQRHLKKKQKRAIKKLHDWDHPEKRGREREREREKRTRVGKESVRG